jgi:uncharacterized short protein YbdD (DUF466 family)
VSSVQCAANTAAKPGLRAAIATFWRTLRTLVGDDAYERYLEHRRLHAHEDTPLTRREFYQRETQAKWNGIKRCC